MRPQPWSSLAASRFWTSRARLPGRHRHYPRGGDRSAAGPAGSPDLRRRPRACGRAAAPGPVRGPDHAVRAGRAPRRRLRGALRGRPAPAARRPARRRPRGRVRRVDARRARRWCCGRDVDDQAHGRRGGCRPRLRVLCGHGVGARSTSATPRTRTPSSRSSWTSGAGSAKLLVPDDATANVDDLVPAMGSVHEQRAVDAAARRPRRRRHGSSSVHAAGIRRGASCGDVECRRRRGRDACRPAQRAHLSTSARWLRRSPATLVAGDRPTRRAARLGACVAPAEPVRRDRGAVGAGRLRRLPPARAWAWVPERRKASASSAAPPPRTCSTAVSRSTPRAAGRGSPGSCCSTAPRSRSTSA